MVSKKSFQVKVRIWFCLKIVQLADVTFSASITNAWPERGASAIKRIKTRLRNRLKNDMVNSLLYISVNEPETEANENKGIIRKAVKCWEKRRIIEWLRRFQLMLA